MTRRILCVLSLIILSNLIMVQKAHAFSLALFPFAASEDKKESGDSVLLQEETPEASDSAELTDAFLRNYFPSSPDAETTTHAISPLPAFAVKGISTYFSSWHPGIDIRADQGSPIYAVNDGVVVESAYQPGGYGKYVVVEHHNNGTVVRSLYAHMKSIQVQIGDLVEGKDVVGQVGMTGHTTGPHVHFETRICPEGTEFYLCTPIDPIRYITRGVPTTLAKK